MDLQVMCMLIQRRDDRKNVVCIPFKELYRVHNLYTLAIATVYSWQKHRRYDDVGGADRSSASGDRFFRVR